MANLVIYEQQGAIGTVTLSRPEALNALNTDVLKQLESLLKTLEKEKKIRALIVTGAGEKAFVAGADIREMNGLASPAASEFAAYGQNVFMQLENLFCPVIAAVNGFALGGGLELALACDFIVASTNAKLGLPECSLGLIPGFGGTVRLARRVGPALAKQWTLSGEMITAARASEAGLVNQVCEPAALIEECRKIAEMMATRSPQSLSLIKRCINETYGVPVLKAMEMERQAFSSVFGTPDQVEGTQAFVEKRKPVFNDLK